MFKLLSFFMIFYPYSFVYSGSTKIDDIVWMYSNEEGIKVTDEYYQEMSSGDKQDKLIEICTEMESSLPQIKDANVKKIVNAEIKKENVQFSVINITMPSFRSGRIRFPKTNVNKLNTNYTIQCRGLLKCVCDQGTLRMDCGYKFNLVVADRLHSKFIIVPKVDDEDKTLPDKNSK